MLTPTRLGPRHLRGLRIVVPAALLALVAGTALAAPPPFGTAPVPSSGRVQVEIEVVAAEGGAETRLLDLDLTAATTRHGHDWLWIGATAAALPLVAWLGRRRPRRGAVRGLA